MEGAFSSPAFPAPWQDGLIWLLQQSSYDPWTLHAQAFSRGLEGLGFRGILEDFEDEALDNPVLVINLGFRITSICPVWEAMFALGFRDPRKEA